MTTTASTPSADKVHQIQATTTPEGEVKFALPIKPELVESVEAIDLDLMLTTTGGEKYILQQGALLATTNTESKLVFSNGDAMSAADQMKRMGVMKPVEGGSFRLASALTPEAADKVTGNEFGLGKDAQDTVAKIEKIIQSLESATQSSQNSESNSSQGLGKNSAFKSNADPLASPAPGTPPKQDTSTSTSNQESISETPRALNGGEFAKISNVVQWDGSNITGKAFSDTQIRQMLPDNQLKVVVTGADPVKSQWSDKVHNTLVLPGVSNAAKVVLTLRDPNAVVPDDFRVNTTLLKNSEVEITTESLKDLKIDLTWTIASDDSKVTPSSFDVSVKYLDASGKELTLGNAPINFSYGDIESINQTYALDSRSNPTLNLSAFGVSYDITGRENTNDEIHAGSGSDILKGLSGEDKLFGDGGNDLLIGGAGADTLDGGSGLKNTASYESSAEKVEVSLTTGLGKGGDAEGDKLTNIQNLSGSNFDDILTGDASSNTLTGNLGNDTLLGNAGADSLIGGDGNDTASYETAGSSVVASLNLSDKATLTGDANGDSYSGIENLIGSDFNDKLIGDTAKNILNGGKGDDILIGGAGSDVLIGGKGTGTEVNTASYENSTSAVVASLNSTDEENLTGDAQGDTYFDIQNLTGSEFNDTLIGDTGTNTIIGGGGDDTLIGGINGDVLDGGTGNNTASYESSSSRVVVSLNTGKGFYGDAEGDRLTNIQSIIGSNFDDKLTGDSDKNILHGGLGHDILIGAGGSDTLYGENGIDTASYETSAVRDIGPDASVNGVVVSLLSENKSTLEGDAFGDVFFGIENLTGSSFNDKLTGDSASNVLNGNSGNDTLIGNAGADSLIGGDGVDTASYETSSTSVVASLSVSDRPTLTGDAFDDTYSGIENLTGSSFDDKLTGDQNSNSLNGGAGDDILIGGAGGDSLIGGLGTDTASYVTAGSRTIQAGVASVTGVVASLLSSDSSRLEGDASGDSYVGIENLTGSSYDDKLTGDQESNTLNGGYGNDVLIGGGSGDKLIGGNDNDTASYETASASVTASLLNSLNNTGDAFEDTYSSIENLKGSRFSDSLTGDDRDNILIGGAGGDSLIGGLGTDTASYVTAGSRTIQAGVASVTGVVASLLSSDSSRLEGDASGDSYVGIENLTGSSFNDKLTGDQFSNILNGSNGNDVLIGGGSGDKLIGGNDNDTASYETASASVTASLLNSLNNTGDAFEDTYSSIENLKGSIHDDVLIGDNFDNILIGNGGTDTYTGNGGTDTIKFESSSSAMVNFKLSDLVGRATGIEKLDIGSDGVGSTLEISAAAIRSIVGNTSNPTLTLVLGSTDKVTFATEPGISHSDGKYVNFYDATSNTPNAIFATAIFA